MPGIQVASALGYFLPERQWDIARLASDTTVQTYFQNRAPGMSMQYGLRASLTQIALQFGEILAVRSMTGHAFFSRLALVEFDGSVLVENDRVPEAARQVVLAGVGSVPLLSSGPAGEQAQVSAAVFFKMQQVGYVLAEVPLSDLLAWANQEPLAASQSWLSLYYNGRLLQSSAPVGGGVGNPTFPRRWESGHVGYAGAWISYR